jgi:hypothetical protein
MHTWCPCPIDQVEERSKVMQLLRLEFESVPSVEQ